MLKAVIFDMDGLLIDSEPFWKHIETQIFSEVGIRITPNDISQTTGLMISEVVEYWYQRFPWNTTIHSKEYIAHKIVEKVKVLIEEQGQGKKGYREIIEFFRTRGYKIGLHSASDYSIIDVVLSKLDIKECFDVIYSGQDEKYGKPHPAGYLSTAEKLGVIPRECLVFEDSLNGILSAKSARMQCIAVPEGANQDNPKFTLADIVIASLDEFDEGCLRELTF